MRSLASVGCSVALCVVLLACSTPTVTTRPSLTPLRGHDARLVSKACADTTYAQCAESLTNAVKAFGRALVAICEYGDGEGDVVFIENRREAETTCSGDGLITPSRVVAVIRLPRRASR
jgi:hypothetical protein